ncbi:MAG: DUF4956 domain-containing protein [Alphaproteobacteria bacterium]|nr:DUF4956 domain-containing protein [Alphaproteobacteria bacterium]
MTSCCGCSSPGWRPPQWAGSTPGRTARCRTARTSCSRWCCWGWSSRSCWPWSATPLARAFGLGAALAIVRFRTPVKDARDAVFLFLSVAIGMASGSGCSTSPCRRP